MINRRKYRKRPSEFTGVRRIGKKLNLGVFCDDTFNWSGGFGRFLHRKRIRTESRASTILGKNRAKAIGLGKMPAVEIVEGDISRPSSLGPALEGVDRALMISSHRMDMAEFATKNDSAFGGASPAA
jgi:hypothetical protein